MEKNAPIIILSIILLFWRLPCVQDSSHPNHPQSQPSHNHFKFSKVLVPSHYFYASPHRWHLVLHQVGFFSAHCLSLFVSLVLIVPA